MHAETLLAEHWPHAPEVSHAGVAPPQSESDSHFRQSWDVPQMGVVPEQSALLWHPTQTSEVRSQSVRGATHLVVFAAEH